MAYLYRHIRLDKNEPFYIGIGNDINYNRAYNKKRRSFSWKDIAYHNIYEVEILLDNLTWEEACEKEKEFIKLYGRRDLKTGILVNMTDGGEGAYGALRSNKTKLKISLSQKGKSKLTSKKGKEHKSFGTKRPNSFGLNMSKLKKGKSNLKNRKPKPEGFSEQIKNNKERHIKICKSIIQYDLNMNPIREWNSIKEASEFLKIDGGSISNCCKGKLKHTKKQIFKYKSYE